MKFAPFYFTITPFYFTITPFYLTITPFYFTIFNFKSMISHWTPDAARIEFYKEPVFLLEYTVLDLIESPMYHIQNKLLFGSFSIHLFNPLEILDLSLEKFFITKILVVYPWPVRPVGSEEKFLWDFVVILKRALQNYYKISKKCFLMDSDVINRFKYPATNLCVTRREWLNTIELTKTIELKKAEREYDICLVFDVTTLYLGLYLFVQTRNNSSAVNDSTSYKVTAYRYMHRMIPLYTYNDTTICIVIIERHFQHKHH